MKKDPDTEQPERIAFATSEPPQPRWAVRWTELAVYFLHRPLNPGRRWRAVVRGCTTYSDEQLREEEITVGTLERALKLFDTNTHLGRSVIAQAEDWAERHPNAQPAAPAFGGESVAAEIIGQGHARPGEVTIDLQPPLAADASQDEALRWLYGEELESAKPQTLLARDFGVGESTARMQLKNGRPVMIPLTAALRFFSRPAFEKAKGAHRE